MSDLALCVLDGEIRRRIDVGYLCAWHRNRLDYLTHEIADLWCDMALVLDGSLPSQSAGKIRHVKIAEAPAPLDLTAAAMRGVSHSGRLGKRAYCHRCGDLSEDGLPRGEAAEQYARWVAAMHSQRTGHLAYVTDGDGSAPLPGVPAIVASWLLCLAEERPLTAKLPGGVVGQLDLLRRHHDWTAGQLWVDDYAAELEELRKAMRLAVRDSAGHVIGRCDLPDDVGGECGGSLLRLNGSETVRCLDCRSEWATAEHRALLMRRLDPRHAV